MDKSQPKRDSSTSTSSIAGESNAAIASLTLEQPALSGGELGTLQEILFGKQLASQSSQLSSLYSHVEAQLANLQQNCDKQFAQLQLKLDQGMNKMSLQLDENDKKQAADLNETNESLSSTETRLMGQLSQANEGNSKVQGQLEAQLKTANEQLTQSMQTSRDEIMDRLEAAISDLQAQKLDKGALSSLLGDVASQLTGQAKD